ncbi:uncharacterized protein [Watersipora subatra]|uniref:uncharacterized protein n=1 Tax=Watersipora subatra TaxID=2589382 RepID=UPI00355B504C
MKGVLYSGLSSLMPLLLALCCTSLTTASTRPPACSLPQNAFRFDCFSSRFPQPRRPLLPSQPKSPFLHPFQPSRSLTPLQRLRNSDRLTGRSQLSTNKNLQPIRQPVRPRRQQSNFRTTVPMRPVTNQTPTFRQTAVAFQSPTFRQGATMFRRPTTRKRPNSRLTPAPDRQPFTRPRPAFRQAPAPVPQSVTRRTPNFRPAPVPVRQPVTRRKPNFRPTPAPVRQSVTRPRPAFRQAPAPIRQPITRRTPNFRPTPAPVRQPVTQPRPAFRQAPAPVRQPVTRRTPNFRPTPAPVRQPITRRTPNFRPMPAPIRQPVTRGRPNVRPTPAPIRQPVTRGRPNVRPTPAPIRQPVTRGRPNLRSAPLLDDRPVARQPAMLQQRNAQRTNGAAIGHIRSELHGMLQQDVTRIADWVQLGFHTCIGGCDGCIDTTNHHNNGLGNSYRELRNLHSTHSSNITLADLIALAAVEAGNEGLRASGKEDADIPYRIGRQTCADPDAPRKQTLFPEGHDPNAIVVLMNEFSITRLEAVALLGAHSLGRCTGANSGFHGPWDNSPNKLDNAYYRSLLGTDWVTTVGPGGKVQWTADRNNPDSRMMLNADMATFKQFTVRGNSSEPSCTSMASCTVPSVDEPTVRRYSQDEKAFHEDFANVYVKMLEKSAEVLTFP